MNQSSRSITLPRLRVKNGVRALLLYAAAVVACTACGGTKLEGGRDSSGVVAGESKGAERTRPDSAGARSASTVMAPANSEQAAVLSELGTLGGKPIESLTAVEARKQPLPTDAVRSLLRRREEPTKPEAVGAVTNQVIRSSNGSIPIRIYKPSTGNKHPVIVYYHGGGFVIATIDTYDASARALSNAAQAIVVSVEYRKAPEAKFPAAHDDALTAYKWVVDNAASLGGNADRIALAGESAGGNLAIATAIAARDGGLRAPVAILAVYPVASNDTTSVSYTQYAMAKPLNRAMMSWFFTQYLRTPADAQDTRLNLVAANLKGLPPTTIITAQIDPLRSDGDALAEKLRAAGVTVEARNYDGVAHEFFGQGAVVEIARDAVKFAGEALRKSLGG